MTKIVHKLNKIYSKVNKWQNINNTQLRKHKKGISNASALLYRFGYSQIDVTQQSVVSNVNYINGTSYYRSSYESKESNISYELYDILLKDTQKLYYDLCANRYSYTDMTVVSTDGTYLNINDGANKPIKSILNLGLYDVSHNCPIDLQYCGENNKNNEIAVLTEYIKSHNIRKVIIVADRAYFSYPFLKFLSDCDIYYVIRIKANSHLLPENAEKYNSRQNKNNSDIEFIKDNSRVLSFSNEYSKLIKVKTQVNEVTISDPYYLITNLNTKYNDNKIKDIYKSRWQVETFFKHIKTNFKFSYLPSKNDIIKKKIIVIDLIITFLIKILKIIYPCKYNYNDSNLISGFYKHILHHLLYGTLTHKILDNVMKAYSITVNNKPNRNFPRTCKLPFLKWYIKSYSEFTMYNKIIDAIRNNKLDTLNKNLLTKAKKIINVVLTSTNK